MSSIRTDEGLKRILNGDIDLLTDTLKLVLLNSAFTPSKDHQYISDISANEISTTNYVGGFAGAGRKTVAGKAVVKDGGAHVVYFDCNDSTWTALGPSSGGPTVGCIALVKEVTNDAASPVIAEIDVSPDIGVNGGDYLWTVAADGVFKIA